MLKTKVLKIATIATLVAGAVLFYWLDLGQFFTLEYLKTQVVKLKDLYYAHPWSFLLAYVLTYITCAALSLPVAGILSLLAGALFALSLGTTVVLAASSIGATLAFLLSRFLFRDTVSQLLKEKVPAIHRGMEREGAFYLFALRLVPIFPFFIVNLAMGLTPIKTWTFFWVSLLGMFPASIVYVNAGSELGGINSLDEVLSLRVIISLALIGLVPLISHAIVRFIRSQRGA